MEEKITKICEKYKFLFFCIFFKTRRYYKKEVDIIVVITEKSRCFNEKNEGLLKHFQW